MCVVALSACSSIVEGTSQQITVVTNPPGAACKFLRNAEILGAVNPTLGGLLVKKTKHHIEVVCEKDGYDEARYLNKSGIQEATFGNLILGGGIGWAIDSASGADNKYESAVNITLPAKGTAATPGTAVLPITGTPDARLNKLRELLDKNLITRDEYERKRAEILNSL